MYRDDIPSAVREAIGLLCTNPIVTFSRPFQAGSTDLDEPESRKRIRATLVARLHALSTLVRYVDGAFGPGWESVIEWETPTQYRCPECGGVITSGIHSPDGDYDDWIVVPHCVSCRWSSGGGKNPFGE